MSAKRLILLIMSVFVLSISGCTSKTDLSCEIPASLWIKKTPLFLERENEGMVLVEFELSESFAFIELNKIRLVFRKGDNPGILKNIVINLLKNDSGDSSAVSSASYSFPFRGKAPAIEVGCSHFLEPGNYRLSFDLGFHDHVLLEKSLKLEEIQLFFGKKQVLGIKQNDNFRFRPAKVLRAANQDGCDTYRIPGIITTSRGTLIAVYDNRYNSSKDLQEDIDIGMSRSTDGGQTWEPMKVIMDMGEWGGRPRKLNGTGDPSVLYDPVNHSIWVAALWLSGASTDAMNWWASRPGMEPTETGQLILVKSTDDGLTWSDPINITPQIKDPEWQLLLAGPGCGITLYDGTLVFPAQFKKDVGSAAIDGGKYTCHSTIIFSKDAGLNWEIGQGAKPNTTEAQVVQLSDGSLMLNMRDDLNRLEKGDANGRAVSITHDLGNTWITHPSSNHALPEPNCMASLIASDIEVKGKQQRVLFFSNPNSKADRTHMTIKASLDEGNTWPKDHQVLLNESWGFGYSCLTMMNDGTLGILYEGIRELYFQKIPVSALIDTY